MPSTVLVEPGEAGQHHARASPPGQPERGQGSDQDGDQYREADVPDPVPNPLVPQVGDVSRGGVVHRVAGEVDAVTLRINHGIDDKASPSGAISAGAQQCSGRGADHQVRDEQIDPVRPASAGVADASEPLELLTNVMADRGVTANTSSQRSTDQPFAARDSTRGARSVRMASSSTPARRITQAKPPSARR